MIYLSKKKFKTKRIFNILYSKLRDIVTKIIMIIKSQL